MTSLSGWFIIHKMVDDNTYTESFTVPNTDCTSHILGFSTFFLFPSYHLYHINKYSCLAGNLERQIDCSSIIHILATDPISGFIFHYTGHFTVRQCHRISFSYTKLVSKLLLFRKLKSIHHWVKKSIGEKTLALMKGTFVIFMSHRRAGGNWPEKQGKPHVYDTLQLKLNRLGWMMPISRNCLTILIPGNDFLLIYWVTTSYDLDFIETRKVVWDTIPLTWNLRLLKKVERRGRVL